MDFYVDLAVAVILRLLKDRRLDSKYFRAIGKVYLEIEKFAEANPAFARTIKIMRDTV